MALWTPFVKVVQGILNPKKLFVSVVKKTILRPVISALKKYGMTNQELYKEMKKIGFETAGKPLNMDTASYIATLDKVEGVQAVPHSQKIPFDLMVESDLRSSRRYRFIAEAEIKTKGQFGTSKKYVSFYTDQLKPLDEYIDDLRSVIDREEYDLDYQIMNLDYQAVLHQKGDTY